ncbi:MAG: hypothetical protein FWE16_02570 [Firmicutes bacterium]|nr:hypothetical protein [Bacillota bacterium]
MKDIDFKNVYFHGFHDRDRNPRGGIFREYSKLGTVLVNGLMSGNFRRSQGITIPEDYLYGYDADDDYVYVTNKYGGPMPKHKNYGAGFDAYVVRKPSIILSDQVKDLGGFHELYGGIWKIRDEIKRSMFVGVGIPDIHLGEGIKKDALKIVKQMLRSANMDLPIYNTTTEERLTR